MRLFLEAFAGGLYALCVGDVGDLVAIALRGLRIDPALLHTTKHLTAQEIALLLFYDVIRCTYLFDKIEVCQLLLYINLPFCNLITTDRNHNGIGLLVTLCKEGAANTHTKTDRGRNQ